MAGSSQKWSGVQLWYGLSRLGDARERRRAMRWLLALALGGFFLTMILLIAAGRGTEHWFFVLVVWLGLIFVPLWLVAAAFETLGPALRVRLARGLAGRLNPQGRVPETALFVEELFAQHVVLPRIATPHEAHKAREATVALVVLAYRQPAGLQTLQELVARCLVGVEAWVRDLSETSASDAGNIQARWEAVRALAAFAALSQTLAAVYENRSGRDLWPDLDGRSWRAFLDAVLDQCDELALRVDGTPWQEPPLGLPVDPATATSLRQAWQRYAQAPQPAPAALEPFLRAALPGVTV